MAGWRHSQMAQYPFNIIHPLCLVNLRHIAATFPQTLNLDLEKELIRYSCFLNEYYVHAFQFYQFSCAGSNLDEILKNIGFSLVVYFCVVTFRKHGQPRTNRRFTNNV